VYTAIEDFTGQTGCLHLPLCTLWAQQGITLLVVGSFLPGAVGAQDRMLAANSGILTETGLSVQDKKWSAHD
jgi:hypothetical protein